MQQAEPVANLMNSRFAKHFRRVDPPILLIGAGFVPSRQGVRIDHTCVLIDICLTGEFWITADTEPLVVALYVRQEDEIEGFPATGVERGDNLAVNVVPLWL